MSYIKGYVLAYTDETGATVTAAQYLTDQTPETLNAGQKVITLKGGEKLTVHRLLTKIKGFIDE